MAGEPDDPFERIAAGASAGPARANAVRAPHGELVAPVPRTAPPIPTEWRGLGTPAASWAYRDASGQVLRHTLRFEKPGGEKDIRPLTLWREANGVRWRLAAEPGRRPLYGLDRLYQRPTAPVLCVEGEKTADAAALLFADFVVITWPGGSNAIGKADFSPLAGRDVVVWPDADEAGAKAGRSAQAAARNVGAASVALATPPPFVPQGWDLADDWPPAFGLAEASAMIAEARQLAAAPRAVEWPFGFRMEREASGVSPPGLYYDQATPTGISPSWLSAPFDVLGEGRSPDGNGWSVVIAFTDRDGRHKTMPVARSRLAGGGAEVRAELADAGLAISPARGRADKFSVALSLAKSERRFLLTASTGWVGDRFALPHRAIGPAAADAVLFTGDGAGLRYGQGGLADAWRAEVAAKAIGNSLMTLALAAGFVGPLLQPLQLEGGGLHLWGNSSAGKTTLAVVAGSIWGGGHAVLGFAQSWRATSNALEQVAFGHNDVALVLDDIGQATPDEVGAAVYMLVGGQSKARSKADGSLRHRSAWRVFTFSTGERSIPDFVRSSVRGALPTAGQEIRVLDIQADAGSGMGAWETVQGAAGPAAFATALQQAAKTHYGHAGPLFVERLIADQVAALDFARAAMAGFLTLALARDDSSQAQRAAGRFAAIAAAGELATAFGVLPWRPGQAGKAALDHFTRWAAGFGRDTPHETREILTRLKGAIESQRSAFVSLDEEDELETELPRRLDRAGEARAVKTLGWRKVVGAEAQYLFHDAGWAEVFKGINATHAARTVLEAGYLETDPGENRLKKSRKIKGEKHRFYAVKGSILESHADAPATMVGAAAQAAPHPRLWRAIRAAHERWNAAGLGAFPPLAPWEDSDGSEAERAAILEFEGGLDRAAADQLARDELEGEP